MPNPRPQLLFTGRPVRPPSSFRPPTLREIRDVIRRDKFDRYVSRATRDRFLRGLVREADFVEPTQQVHACRDPDDDKYLALALQAQAACIVSGDNDLLVLTPFEGIPIMRPNEFIEWMQEGKTWLFVPPLGYSNSDTFPPSDRGWKSADGDQPLVLLK